MKIKKLLVLVSMLAVMFSLAGCDENYDAPFEYNESQIVIDSMYLFEEYVDVDKKFADYYINYGTEFEKSAVKGIVQAKETDKVGNYEDYSTLLQNVSAESFDISTVDAKVINGKDYVTVKFINNASERDVEISVKFVENAQYYIEYDKLSTDYIASYLEEVLINNIGVTLDDYVLMVGIDRAEYIEYTREMMLLEKGITPYIPEEMVVSAVYSNKELVGQAGMNTLIGMGTVFIVLIFISFIISLFKYLPALFAKKPKVEVEKKAETPKAVATPVAVADNNENLADDSQLVAVITAAIYAYEAQSGNGAVSKDKLVVRSIKRVRK
ncbi:MAG: OadG family protein [Lachnospiraceae bacterium]|nr:OadG family protein [Lachnospiraceae bacterium]